MAKTSPWINSKSKPSTESRAAEGAISPSPLSREHNRLRELDGLRGIAIASVVTWHYFGMLPLVSTSKWEGLAKVATRMTWSGVDLFFVLSGYLIANNLLASRARRDYFSSFYIRRFARILPLYLLVLVVTGIFDLSNVASSSGETGTTSLPAWTYATFTQNIAMASAQSFGASELSVTWSLAVEEQFYLILPLLIYLLPNALIPIFAAAACIGALFLRWFLVDTFGVDAYLPNYVLFPTRCDSLFIGVLTAWALGRPELFARLRERRRTLHICVLLFTSGAVWMTLTARGVIMSPDMSVWGYTFLTGLYASVLVTIVVHRDGLLNQILRMRAVEHLGVISYGIYLFHQPIDFLLQDVVIPVEGLRTPIASKLVAVAVTLLLAEISWLSIERPLIKWSRRQTCSAQIG